MVLSQCCVLGYDGKQLFLPGMVILQTKDSFSLASFFVIIKNNVTSQPRAFPIVIAQHVVAQLTWIKTFLALGCCFFFLFFCNERSHLPLLTYFGFLVVSFFSYCSGLRSSLWWNVWTRERAEMSHVFIQFFSLIPEEPQLVRHGWNRRWGLREQWTGGDFSEELDWYLNLV